MPRYVVTVPSSKSPQDAFAYMSDMRLFTEWDKGIKKVDDLGHKNMRFVNREPGSGSRALLDSLLAKHGIQRENIHGYEVDPTDR